MSEANFFRKYSDIITEATTVDATPKDARGYPLAAGDVINAGGANLYRIDEIIMVPACVISGHYGKIIEMCKDVKLIAQSPSESEYQDLLQRNMDGMIGSNFKPTTPEHLRGGQERSDGKRTGL